MLELKFDITFVDLFSKLLSNKNSPIQNRKILDSIFDLKAYKTLFDKEYLLNKRRFIYLTNLSLDKHELSFIIKNHYHLKKNNFKYLFYYHLLNSIQLYINNYDKINLFLYDFVSNRYDIIIKKKVEDFIQENDLTVPIEIHYILSSCHFGYDPILINVGMLLNSRKKFVDIDSHINMLAHEVYHNVRNKLIEIDFNKAGNDYYFLWLVEQIITEGIADHIDIYQKYLKHESSKFVMKHKEVQKKQPATIAKINEILNNKKSIDEMKNSVFDSYHSLGYYVVSKIISYYGKDVIKEISLNPYIFFRTFNNLKNTDIKFCDRFIDKVKYFSTRYYNVL